jgi:hypothetical protein
MHSTKWLHHGCFHMLWKKFKIQNLKFKKKTIIIFGIDIYSFVDNFLNNVNISTQVHM